MSRSRILATDVQERSMLAAERSLSRAGFAVTGVGTRWDAPGLWSRAPATRRLASDPRDDVEGFLTCLTAIAGATRHDLLLPGTDQSLFVVSRYRDRLLPYVDVALPAHSAVVRSLDRWELITAAGAVGLTAPESVLCETPEQAQAAAAALGYPIVVKPLETVTISGGFVHRRASELAWDAAEVSAASRRLGRCVVQRRIRGDVVSFGGVVDRSGLVAYVVSRYTRTWPPDAGNVAFSETIEPPAGLAERVEAMIAAIGNVGVFEVELIEEGGGEFAAIDLNPRPYGSLALADAAGVPLPALWCRALLGPRPRSGPARVGVHYRWEDADLRHGFVRARDGDPGAMLAVMRPHRHVAHAYTSLSDPLPALARVIQLTRRIRGHSPGGRDSRTASSQQLPNLESAREPWQRLEQATGNVFSSWDWADVWWRYFGRGRELELRQVQSGEATAILPLYAEHRPGVTLRRLVGHGVGDQLGPVCAAADALTAIRAMGAIELDRSVLLVERVPAGDHWPELLDGAVIHHDACPYIDLAAAGGWDGLLASYSAGFRSQIRRRVRRLAKRGVTFRLAEDPARLDRDFDALLALHDAHWGAASTAFAGPREAFHRDFAHRALERGWLRLWLAEHDGTPVAAWYGFRFAGIESYYQAGRDPAWDRESVGSGLLEHTIREAAQDGMREYRMLRGDERYKHRYAAVTAPLSTIVVSRGIVGRTGVAAIRLVAQTRAGRRLLNRYRD